MPISDEIKTIKTKIAATDNSIINDMLSSNVVPDKYKGELGALIGNSLTDKEKNTLTGLLDIKLHGLI